MKYCYENLLNYKFNLVRQASIIVLTSFLLGCVSTKTQDVYLKSKIVAPKIIAIEGQRWPWFFEIEKRLRAKGFKILRMASQHVTTEKKSDNLTESYNQATSRYILFVDGYAPNTGMTRCLGGGYDFQYINVELVDVQENQTVFNYSNSGYSENCPPLSGTIFTDIADLVENTWR